MISDIRTFLYWECPHLNIYVHICTFMSTSYCKWDPAKVLESQEKEKKRKYLEACLERRRHFTPFVCSVDGMLGREAKTFAKRLAAKLASKQMGKVPLTSAGVWTRQCSTEHRHCSRHAPVYERKPSPCTQNQHPLSPMGRRCWPIII